MGTELKVETSPTQRRQQSIEKYWAGDMARKVYLLRRQRKAILEHCRRVAVIGASDDPDHPSYIAMEKLMGLGLEMIPIFSGRESFLGVRCYVRLRDVPGKIDIVQVFANGGINVAELAREAVEKGVSTFWIEKGMAASQDVENILADGRVQLVEYESLATEYLKHSPTMPSSAPVRKDRKAAKVKEKMTRNPITVTPEDALKDAVSKMEHGHFRHLPVVDRDGKLMGMLSDRDIRLIRPSLAFVDKEDAILQLWSLGVQQTAVFDPVSVRPETTLKGAAELMLRWHVGGLPVADDQDRLVGIVTYTDVLRDYVGREDDH